MYCFDPRHFVITPYGHPKTGAYRAQFMLESVQDLKASLQKIGSDLIIHLGKPEEAIAGEHLPAVDHQRYLLVAFPLTKQGNRCLRS